MQSARDKAKAPISASLANVPFEIAVSTLAEAAGLRAIRNGNTVLVVTPARAKELTDSERKLSVSMGQMVLSLEDLQAIAKLFPGKASLTSEDLLKEVNRLRTEKVPAGK